jgi:hypothetical protein
MKDQSLRMPISLKEINRKPADGLQDGALLDLINMRFTGGALRPILEKVLVPGTLPQFNILYKHVINERVYAYWGEYADYLCYSVYEDDLPVHSDMAFAGLVEGQEAIFSAIGNAMLYSIIDNELTYVALFEPDTNTYRSFASFLPDMPRLSYQRIAVAADDETKSDATEVTNMTIEERYDYMDKVIAGLAQDLLVSKQEKGYLTGYYLVRTAWELFDGSIVFHNTPVLFKASEMDGREIRTGSPEQATTYVRFVAYKAQQKVNISSGDLTTLQTKYKGIVKSLNIYVTNHRPFTEWNSMADGSGHYDTGYRGIYYMGTTGWGPYQKWIEENILYFELKKIPLEEIVAETWADIKIDDTTTLSSGVVLTPGNFSCHRIFGKSLFNYNQRIFLGNIKNRLFKGTSLRNLIIASADDTSGTAYNIGFSFDIDTVDGTRRVFTGWSENVSFYWSVTPADFRFGISLYDFLGYPDQRAFQMDIWHKDNIGIIRHLKTVKLTPVIGMNFAFVIPCSSDALDTDGNGNCLIDRASCDYTVLPINESDSYYDGDRVQATEFQNPFYYPAANSYRVDGFVLGMATNAIPLGSSQFGQYPIFVFTTKGIWAFNIGNGEILIDSITPLSGTICMNRRTILGIDGGVIFMSNEGLMIISGKNPMSISELVAGIPESPLRELGAYQKIMDDPNTYRPVVYQDEVTFEAYADGANIAFVTINTQNGVEKEIIVSNSDYDYSYVYSIITKTWHRITSSWDSFLHDFPYTYGVKYEAPYYNLYDLTEEQTDPDHEKPIMIHLETRPIRYGEEISHKKLSRSMIYGYINPAEENPFTFYLFGSVNDRDWFVQSASLTISPGEKVTMGRTGFSSRKFIFVLGGYVYADSYISGLISDMEKKYNLKLT